MKSFLNFRSNLQLSVVTTLLFFVVVLMSNTAYSHGDHAHPPVLTDIKAIEKATKDVSIIVDQNELVEGKKIDVGWKQIAVKDKHIYEKTEKYVIVSFKKNKEKTLYILLSIYGRYLAVNFSGKFEGI